VDEINSLEPYLTSIHLRSLSQRNSRYLANYHEQALFTDPDVDGIGNIAAHTIIPPIVDALEKISNTSSELKLQYIGVAYKPVSAHDQSLTRGFVTHGKNTADLVLFASSCLSST
jgi:hypothetical protein